MMKAGQGYSLCVRGLILGLGLLISAMASAIEPTEVQLDKLSPEQLRQAAEAGDPDAQYALGYMYYYGNNGVPQDTQQAVNWIKRASVQGQSQAVKALAMMQPETAKAPKASESAPPSSTTKSESAVAESPKAVVAVSSPSATPPTKTPVSSIKTQATASASAGAPLASGEQHLLGLSSDQYTIQVLGSYSERDVINYINKHNLRDKVVYYRGDRDGKDWYVALYGAYQTSKEAKAAIADLPVDVQKQKPWVKLLSSVQEDIKKKRA